MWHNVFSNVFFWLLRIVPFCQIQGTDGRTSSKYLPWNARSSVMCSTWCLQTCGAGLPMANERVHGSRYSVQLLVEAARITDGRALGIGGPSPQWGLVGVTVDTPCVRTEAKAFNLQMFNLLYYIDCRCLFVLPFRPLKGELTTKLS